MAMIGHGMIMKGHFNYMLSKKHVQILAVGDVDRTKREKAIAQAEATYSKRYKNGSYKGCEDYNEHEQIMARSDIDACFVCTPDHWHVPISLDAVRSGKDVYVEKPMSLTIREGRILTDAVRRNGAVLQVGSQQRSEPAFRKAAEMVRNGWIGKIHTVYVKLGKFPPSRVLAEEPVPDGFDYDRWLGPTPWFPYNFKRIEGNYGGGWRSFWEYGSRKNGDWGAHHYDIIQWALGMDSSGPGFFFPKGHKGSEWQGYTYADGPTIYRDHPSDTGLQIEFHGEKGMVAVNRGNQLVTTPGDLGGSAPTPPDVPEPSPEQIAADEYNTGLKYRERALAADEKAMAETDAKKRAKAEGKRDDLFAKAAKRFEMAIENKPDFAQAHGSLGYALRRLGRHEEAMVAYDRALSLNPNYPAAIEYRGEALLGLHRVAEAQEAYQRLALISDEHADQLLAAVKAWAEKESNATAASEANLAEWISDNERLPSAGAQGGPSSWR